MGKTTLLTAFARQVHDDGAVVLYGRADEDLNAPYEPWVEVARSASCGCLPDDALAAHVAQKGRALASIVPELGSRIAMLPPKPPVDPESERFLLVRSGRRSARLGRRRWGPVVVVLDDLQWADRPSLQLLRHLVSLPVDGPDRSLVGSVRDTDVGRRSSDGRSVRGAPSRDRRRPDHVAPGSTTPRCSSCSNRSRAMSSARPALALRDTLLAETDGNPFFTHRGPASPRGDRHVAPRRRAAGGKPSDGRADRGACPSACAKWSAAASRGSATLTSSALLGAAAVLGRDFDIDILEQVCSSDIDADVARSGFSTGPSPRRCSTRSRPLRVALTFAHALFQRTHLRRPHVDAPPEARTSGRSRCSNRRPAAQAR